MTIGTAIVIVMLLYLLDKHGLLKRAAGIVALLSFLALAWIFGQQQYQKWQHARYIRHHTAMQASLIAKYHGAIPRPPAGFQPVPQVQWDDERPKPAAVQSVPVDELDKQKPPAKSTATNIPTLDPSEVEIEGASKVIYIDDICKEPQWVELSHWERTTVVEAVMPKMDYFDRMHLVDGCN